MSRKQCIRWQGAIARSAGRSEQAGRHQGWSERLRLRTDDDVRDPRLLFSTIVVAFKILYSRLPQLLASVISQGDADCAIATWRSQGQMI